MEIANIQKNQLVNFNQSQLNKAFLSEGIQVWSKKKTTTFSKGNSSSQKSMGQYQPN